MHVGTSDLEPLNQASSEQEEALFRKESNDYARNSAWEAPPCPFGTPERPLVCDCPKSKALKYGEHVCTADKKCIVRVVRFPNGTY